jgi:hypothetical protein
MALFISASSCFNVSCHASGHPSYLYVLLSSAILTLSSLILLYCLFSSFKYDPLLLLLSIVPTLFLKFSFHSYFLSSNNLFLTIYFTELGFFNLLDSIFADFKEKDVTSDKKTEEQILDFVSKIEPIFIFCLIWWVKGSREFCINVF